MRIISKGILPKDKTYTTTCNKCKTMYEFTQSDGTLMNDRNELIVCINCPVCKSSAAVKA